MMRLPVCVNLDVELIKATKGVNRSELINEILGVHLSQNNTVLERIIAPMMSGEFKTLCDLARRKGVTAKIVRSFRDRVMIKGTYLSQFEAYNLIRKAIE